MFRVIAANVTHKVAAYTSVSSSVVISTVVNVSDMKYSERFMKQDFCIETHSS
jgi:hypothetical protein